MSISQEIKNYMEFISEWGRYESFNSWIQYTFLYLLGWIKTSFIWFISLAWLRDFFQSPIYTTAWPTTVFSEAFLPYSSIKAAFNYTGSTSNSLNYGLRGLINGFFLSLPCSAVYLLWLRRLVVEGVPASIVSAAGIIAGQTWLFLATALGFRFLLFSWFSMEPLSYFLGVSLTLWIVYKTTHSPIKRLKWRNRSTLFSVFISSAALVWTDQTGLFGYMNNLSVSFYPSILEIGVNQPAFNVWTELIVLISGQIIGFLIFGWLCLVFGRAMVGIWAASYSRWVQIFNFGSLTLVIALTLTSFPHYSFDYLFLSPMGFSSTDGCLSPLQLQTTLRDVSRGRLGECSSHTSLDVDVAPFDRGCYSTGSEIELTFEDLNYQGEYIWRSRNDRLASGSAGVVNKFMSKFLPKPTSAETFTDTELNQIVPIRPYERVQNVFSPNQWDRFEGLTERFLEDYSTGTDESVSSRINENGEPFSAFSELVKYGFDTFASLDEIASDEFEEALGKKIKLKYYANPVYKLLLRLDISNFLGRQPLAHFIAPEDEKCLFDRRRILNSYYNSLRSYSTIPNNSAFYDLFFGSKAYASRVYNQQFKGTLKILRRLFAINLYIPGPNRLTILKFDQPLYTSGDKLDQLFIHEELENEYKRKFNDFVSNHSRLQETLSIPLYAGWDLETRRFVITNRWSASTGAFLSTTLDNKEIKQANKIYNPRRTSPLRSVYNREKPKIEFIAWPVQSLLPAQTNYNLLYDHANSATNQQHDLHDLFEYAESGDYETRLIYETLPSFVRRVDLRNKDKNQVNLSPVTRGLSWSNSRKS